MNGCDGTSCVWLQVQKHGRSDALLSPLSRSGRGRIHSCGDDAPCGFPCGIYKARRRNRKPRGLTPRHFTILPLVFGLAFVTQSQVVHAGVALFVMITIIVGSGVVAYVGMKRTVYYISDDRLGVQSNFFGTRRQNVRLENVVDVSYKQSIIGSYFGVGKVNFKTAGDDGTTLSFRNLENAEELYNELESRLEPNSNN